MFRFWRRPRTGRHSRPWYRPELLRLEDRIVLSTITVDATHTLQSALTQANPAGGDVIQIEPGASISTLSQSGGTVVNPTVAGATTITVSQLISPAEVISIGSGPTADNNILVDSETPVGSDFQLTLHTALANAHAAGESVTPLANTIGVGKPVAIQGDPSQPIFNFPSGLVLEMFKATASTAPVTLQNLAFSISSGTIFSGATAGDFNVLQDNLTVNGNSSTAINVNVAGNENITGATLTLTGSTDTGDSSTVAGSQTINATSIAVTGATAKAISSTVGGNQAISQSLLFVNGDGSDGDSAAISGSLTIRASTLTATGNNSDVESSAVTGAVTITASLLNLNGDGGAVIGGASQSGGSYSLTNNSINVTGNGGSNGNDFAIQATSAGSFLLSGNTIRMTNNPGVAVSWTAASSVTIVPAQGTILNNVISTNNLGTGLLLNQQATAAPVLVQGNDFTNNKIGVQIQGNGTSIGTIDLGGGSLGSLGGNDFRLYPAPGATGSFAIILTGTNSSATVSAHDNIWDVTNNGDGTFSVIDPHTHIQDGSNNTGSTGTGTIDVGTTQLSADEEYVQSLYRILLGRVGTVAELDAWVPQIAAQGAAGKELVARGILHDAGHEAYTHLVDGYYLQLFGRAADASDEAVWVNQFVSGATEEQVLTGLLTSSEFAQDNQLLVSTNNSDAGFVQALYSVLLHRDVADGTLTQTEINNGVTLLNSRGRAGLVTDFLTGTDFKTSNGSTFREAAVRAYYGDPTQTPLPFQPFLPNLLHRLHMGTFNGQSEMSIWDGTGLDLLTMEVFIAGDNGNSTGGPEFYRHG